MSELIRVGIIGAGGNTRSRHIPGLLAQSGVEIVSVANRTRASGERAAKEFGIPRVAGDWTEVVADPEVDAVCIGTWPYTHRMMTVAALRAGKHVLCEARMAMNAAEAREMLAVSREHPAQVAQIVPAPHTLALDRTIVERVGDGYIGELITLDARVAVGSSFPQWDAPVHWRHDRTLSGNNVMSMGIWYEAMMRWTGPARTVMAIGRSVVPHRRDPDGRRTAMTIPDHIDVIGEMEQGGQMRFSVTTAVGYAPAVEVYLFGTEGTLRITDGGDGFALYGGRRGEAGLAPVEIDPAKRGAWRVEEEFVNAIRGLEPVIHTDLATGVRYMEWTDAVARSVRTGEAVVVGA